jgi:hypothetical protein
MGMWSSLNISKKCKVLVSGSQGVCGKWVPVPLGRDWKQIIILTGSHFWYFVFGVRDDTHLVVNIMGHWSCGSPGNFFGFVESSFLFLFGKEGGHDSLPVAV